MHVTGRLSICCRSYLRCSSSLEPAVPAQSKFSEKCAEVLKRAQRHFAAVQSRTRGSHSPKDRFDHWGLAEAGCSELLLSALPSGRHDRPLPVTHCRRLRRGAASQKRAFDEA